MAVSMTAAKSVSRRELRQKTSCDPILDHCLDARFDCYECCKACRSCNVSRSFVPYSRLACAECGLFQTVLCKSWKESFE